MFRSCCLLLILASACAVEPLVVFDREITVSQGTHHWPVRDGLPGDWTAPVDYTAGDCYVYWEVLEAPAGAEHYVLQLGWTFPGQAERNFHLLRFKYLHLLPESERYQPPVFRAGATFETRHRMNHRSYFWPIDGRDYSRGIAEMMAYCRTHPEWQVRGPPGPVRLRVTMTLVPPGAVYHPPTSFGGLRGSEIPAIPDVAAAMHQREPGRALALAERLVGAEGDTGTQAAQAVAALTAHVAERRAAIEQTWLEDPVAAVVALAELATAFSETSHAQGLTEQGQTWQRDDRYRDAARAQRYLDGAQVAVARIRERVGANADLTDASIARRVQRELKAVGAAYAQLARRHPDSIQRERCAALLRSLGIEPPS